MEGIKIPFVTLTKFLGVWIDSDLSWNMHVGNLIRKLKQKLKLLQLSKNLLDINTKKILYHAQFCSHIRYGLLLWGNSVNETLKDKIQKLQNQAFTLIFRKDPTIPNFHSCGLLIFNKLLKLDNSKLFYNCLHNACPKKNQGCSANRFE